MILIQTQKQLKHASYTSSPQLCVCSSHRCKVVDWVKRVLLLFIDLFYEAREKRTTLKSVKEPAFSFGGNEWMRELRAHILQIERI